MNFSVNLGIKNSDNAECKYGKRFDLRFNLICGICNYEK